jgi:siroheme synthase-like protein
MDRDKGKESQAPCRLLPVLLDLSDKHVCVIGAAPEAERYARFLAACTRHLSVLCEEGSEELKTLAEEGCLSLLEQPYSREVLFGMDIVFCVSGSEPLISDVSAICRTMGITLYTVGRPDKSDFMLDTDLFSD